MALHWLEWQSERLVQGRGSFSKDCWWIEGLHSTHKGKRPNSLISQMYHCGLQKRKCWRPKPRDTKNEKKSMIPQTSAVVCVQLSNLMFGPTCVLRGAASPKFLRAQNSEQCTVHSTVHWTLECAQNSAQCTEQWTLECALLSEHTAPCTLLNVHYIVKLREGKSSKGNGLLSRFHIVEHWN